MPQTPEHSSNEDRSLNQEPATPPPVENVPARLPLPDSPMERARLEAQGKLPARDAEGDRSTMVAFGLLFVVPLLIIVLSLLLLLPFINAQMNRDSEPGGATVQMSPNQLPPQRQ